MFEDQSGGSGMRNEGIGKNVTGVNILEFSRKADRWSAPQEAQKGTPGFHFCSNLRLFQKSAHLCLFPFLSHLNNPIRKHTSSNDAFKSAAGKTYISSSAERLILCTLIWKILCGFISTNPSLRLYISVIPTSERSPTAGRTAARGGFTWIMVIDIYAHCISFVSKQEKQGLSPFPIPLCR